MKIFKDDLFRLMVALTILGVIGGYWIDRELKQSYEKRFQSLFGAEVTK